MTRPEQGSAPEAGGLVGYWQGSGESVQFNADGTLEYAGQNFLYLVGKDVLTLVPLDNVIQLPYTQKGDFLVVMLNGQPKAFMRQADGQQNLAVSQALGELVENVMARNAKMPNSQAGSTATSSGAGTNALAGVWVGQESSLDPSFYMSYTQYLILYPDGSVGYDKSEGGATRNQVSAAIERFTYFSSGRTGNRDVAGQWQSDGNSIAIRWRDNTTWQGQVDLTSGRMMMFGVGVIEGGSNVLFQRQ